jgi:hypothetical protein
MKKRAAHHMKLFSEGEALGEAKDVSTARMTQYFTKGQAARLLYPIANKRAARPLALSQWRQQVC